MVNGEAIAIDKGLLEYTLNNFKDVREDKVIAVEFSKKLEIENPETGSFMPVLLIFVLSFDALLLYLYSKEYISFKRI